MLYCGSRTQFNVQVQDRFRCKDAIFYFILLTQAWTSGDPKQSFFGPLLDTYSTTLTIQIYMGKETFSMRYQILTAWLRTITARCRRIRGSSMFLESLKPSLMKLQLTMALIQSFESEKKGSASVKVTQR